MSATEKRPNSAEKTARPAPIRLIQPVREIIRTFPATRYYGSKRKLLDWIYSGVSGLSFETVLDAFGGTGSVSLLFQAMRKSVTYHDGPKFNEDVGRTLLSGKIEMSRDELVAFIDDTVPQEGKIANNYHDIFYPDDENRWLGGFISQLVELGQEKASLLRYLLYQACLKKLPFNLFHRANLYLRTNDAERTFGNHTTWERSFKHHIVQAYDELVKCVTHKELDVTVLPSSSLDEKPNLILCGYTCAGKTVASQHLARSYGYLHVEASDFMHLSYLYRHGFPGPVAIGDFAEQALMEKPDIAAEKIADYISEYLSSPIVISGFRAPEEIESLSSNLANQGKLFEKVFVESDQQTRFERLRARMRPGDVVDLEAFQERDQQQKRMGLERIRRKKRPIYRLI